MPKINEIKKVLVIGSGPIIIGQAAEFDYAGTQACRALKEEGIETVLLNSNPATIMTDTDIADKVYIEPLTVEILKKVIEAERPDSLLPTLGGQTGLNLAMEISKTGYLDDMGVKLLGTAVEAIEMAEDRQKFKEAMERIGQPVIASKEVGTVEKAIEFAESDGYPVIVRPAFTMGGSGGGIATNKEALIKIARSGLRYSRVTRILVERGIAGWKEIEYEVMRDAKGNTITVCNMENIDPVGVHTGDSIVVAPSQTLSDKEYQMLRTASLNIISELKIEGGCNVQFALNPYSFEYAVIEVNPRVSRSSALASKATGYPIAKVATKIAIGYGLDEIKNVVTGNTFACFEPTLDYVVVKIPRWPFDKFVNASRTLGTQMKATGEVMAIGGSLESALLKAIRSLELGMYSLEKPSISSMSREQLIKALEKVDDMRLFLLAGALRKSIKVREINKITKVDSFFLNKIKNIVDEEEKLKKTKLEDIDESYLRKLKKLGFADNSIDKLTKSKPGDCAKKREKARIRAVYKMVDTCAGEFKAKTQYYYSTYDEECEVVKSESKKILVIGSGPIRIGQGIEFDYCSVHCVWALREMGYETIIINSNPETVSTDFDTADRLYFEPLTPEDVAAVIETEKPDGAIVQFGGQTAIKLTQCIADMGVPILGTSPESMDDAEDRGRFEMVLEKANIPRPEARTVYTAEEAIRAGRELIYPVLVRPSYVLGGKGMEIAYDDKDIEEFMNIINIEKQEHPILVDKYMMGREIEVDAICDGQDILIPGIMEHLERAGVHSGDSISVYPPITLSKTLENTLVEYTRKISLELKIKGVVNIQYVIHNDKVYVIEVNPRSSRTVPYISKVTGIPVIKIATYVAMGGKLSDFDYGTGLYPKGEYYALKVPVFSFDKLHDVDASLGPEMKSTGEVLGISKSLNMAIYKGLVASGMVMPENRKNVLLTVKRADQPELLPIAEKLKKLGYTLYGTGKTAAMLNKHGVATNVVRKIGEGERNVLELMESDTLCVVINTPTKGRKPERDGFKIRRKAVETSIPCLTSLDTATAFVNCLEKGLTMQDLEIVELSALKGKEI